MNDELSAQASDAEPRAAVPTAIQLLQSGIAAGLHPGAQLFVRHRGRTVADVALGEARIGVPMRPESLLVWLSASKPIGTLAIAQLWERGIIDLEAPVAAYIPEFSAAGKEAVTTAQLLMHTAPMARVDTGWPRASWDEIINVICDTPLEAGSVPGQRAAYQQLTTWYVVGELVRRLTGVPYEQYVRSEIFLPLGLRDSWVGMDERAYDAYGDRIGLLYASSTPPMRPMPPWDMKEAITHCRPAANGCGPIRELGLLYAALLAGGVGHNGARIFDARTIAYFTDRHRVGMYDYTFRHQVDWGLGFIVNSNRYGADTVPYGFGRYAGERTFGHNGFQTSSAFADPDHDLVVALICNGAPGPSAHEHRHRAVLGAVYEDLGLNVSR